MSDDEQFHHGKDHHIWTYCLHLGPFTDSGGGKWDLGIHNKDLYRHGPSMVSFGNVEGPEPHEYCSGSVNHVVRGLQTGKYPAEGPYGDNNSFEASREAIKRWEVVAPEEFLAVSNHEAGRPVDPRWVGYRVPTYGELEVASTYKKWFEFAGQVTYAGAGDLHVLRKLVDNTYSSYSNAEDHEVAFAQATLDFIDAEMKDSHWERRKEEW